MRPPPDAIRKQKFIHYFPDMATPDTHFIHCPWVLQWRSMSALTVIGIIFTFGRLDLTHDDVIKWKHFPRYWPFVRGIHRSPVNSPHKGQWRRASMFFFYLRLNKRLSKQSWGWWFETLSRPLWRHCNTQAQYYQSDVALLNQVVSNVAISIVMYTATVENIHSTSQKILY